MAATRPSRGMTSSGTLLTKAVQDRCRTGNFDSLEPLLIAPILTSFLPELRTFLQCVGHTASHTLWCIAHPIVIGTMCVGTPTCPLVPCVRTLIANARAHTPCTFLRARLRSNGDDHPRYAAEPPPLRVGSPTKDGSIIAETSEV